MPASMSKERRTLLKAYGAELVLTDPHKGMTEAVATAERIVAETPGAVLARQFDSPANAEIHRRTTAEEIWRDTDGHVDYFVAGSGTGGTITGVGQVLKQRNPDVKIALVEPKDSPVLTEGRAGGHRIQGIGPNFVPEVLDRSVVDEIFDVEFDDAIRVARELATREGILAGMSAGAAVWAALQIAARPEAAGKRIVVIIPDAGERYLSTALYEHLREPEAACMTERIGAVARIREDLAAAKLRDPGGAQRPRDRTAVPRPARRVGAIGSGTRCGCDACASSRGWARRSRAGSPASRSTPARRSAGDSSSTTAWAS